MQVPTSLCCPFYSGGLLDKGYSQKKNRLLLFGIYKGGHILQTFGFYCIAYFLYCLFLHLSRLLSSFSVMYLRYSTFCSLMINVLTDGQEANFHHLINSINLLICTIESRVILIETFPVTHSIFYVQLLNLLTLHC